MANEEFKIGDKVVCPEAPKDRGFGGLTFTPGMLDFVGQVGEVVAYGQLTNSIKVLFPSTGESYYFKPHWIVHHEEPVETFNIGDKVYCREVPANVLEGPTFQPVMINYLGEVGEIVGSRSKTTGAFKVRFPSTGKCFFFLPKWLTKLSIHRGYAPLTKPDSPLLKGDYETVYDGIDMKKAFAEAMDGDSRLLEQVKQNIIIKASPGYPMQPSKTVYWSPPIEEWVAPVDEKPATPPKWRFGRFRYTEPSRMVDVVFEGKWEKGNVQGR